MKSLCRASICAYIDSLPDLTMPNLLGYMQVRQLILYIYYTYAKIACQTLQFFQNRFRFRIECATIFMQNKAE